MHKKGTNSVSKVHIIVQVGRHKPCKCGVLLWQITTLWTKWKYMTCSVCVSACLLIFFELSVKLGAGLHHCCNVIHQFGPHKPCKCGVLSKHIYTLSPKWKFLTCSVDVSACPFAFSLNCQWKYWASGPHKPCKYCVLLKQNITLWAKWKYLTCSVYVSACPLHFLWIVSESIGRLAPTNHVNNVFCCNKTLLC